MILNKETIITQQSPKQLRVVRHFDADLPLVWDAWTKKDLLDEWWALKPYKARTKSMDFREGGMWMYCMEGPAGDQQWCRADFISITPQENFSMDEGFCDANGNITKEIAPMHWKVYFKSSGDGTEVKVDISFASEEELKKIVEMGFKEGFTAAHGNLDELLQQHK